MFLVATPVAALGLLVVLLLHEAPLRGGPAPAKAVAVYDWLVFVHVLASMVWVASPPAAAAVANATAGVGSAGGRSTVLAPAPGSGAGVRRYADA